MPNEQPGFSLGTVFRILATCAFYYLSASGALERLPAGIVERMNMHRLSARVRGRASRFRDASWSARRCRVNGVAIQRDLQENRWHYLT